MQPEQFCKHLMRNGDGYSVSGRTWTLSIGAQRIPAGTAYIVYEGTEHLGSGGAYFGMFDFNMVFRDGTAPSVITAPIFIR